jgi:hypothetical protein
VRVGKIINLYVTSYKRNSLGPKYKGVLMFMLVDQHKVMPERIDNFYSCAADSETSLKFVNVEDLCTLLSLVNARSGDPTMVNLVPVAHAFPISWIKE